MKIKFLFALIMLSKISFCQSYSCFFWNKVTNDFNSVKLNVKDLTTKKTIFNGYKDSQITISQNTNDEPNQSSIYAKIGGYLEFNSIDIISFDYKIENELTSIQYGATYENGVALFTFLYHDYKLKKISVLTGKSSKKQVGSNLIFELDGFE